VKKKESNEELVAQVIRGARDFSTGTVLFHRAVGQILGVNVTDMKTLDIMTQQGSATPSQLTSHTGLSSGATTAMIDRLERAGLVQRRPHPKDRRGTILVLTHEAKRKLPSLFTSLGSAMETLVSSYSEKELVVLNDFFTKARFLWREEFVKLERRDEERSKTRGQKS
jgi:DNA-binding MarR family transcriptional regulator